MKYFEDYEVGARRELGARTVTKEEIVAFARDFDPQAFHVDEAAANESFFGGIIASGWHTCSIAMRMIVDRFLRESASMGSPGVDNLRWKKPVRPGDTLRLVMTVKATTPSRSKPDRGIVTNDLEMFDQHGDVVMSMTAMTMLGRRPPVS
ncbi:MAG: MaoC family dehydratase [Vulcanimicrobiaceae bacterium]